MEVKVEAGISVSTVVAIVMMIFAFAVHPGMRVLGLWGTAFTGSFADGFWVVVAAFFWANVIVAGISMAICLVIMIVTVLLCR
jgi:hypothetical protein